MPQQRPLLGHLRNVQASASRHLALTPLTVYNFIGGESASEVDLALREISFQLILGLELEFRLVLF
jgi:hypothetical protein